MRIGVLGGTFDPIHLAHLALAEEAREEAALQQVLFVPAGLPPHKRPQEVLAAGHRLEMVRLALAACPHFHVRELELDREGFSYTLDTVEALAREFAPRGELFLIVGADQVLELENWKDPRSLVEACTLLIAPRPGFELGELPAWVAGRARLLTTTRLAISSREIRERVRAGRSIRFLVPDPVRAYIEDHRLYRA